MKNSLKFLAIVLVVLGILFGMAILLFTNNTYQISQLQEVPKIIIWLFTAIGLLIWAAYTSGEILK